VKTTAFILGSLVLVALVADSGADAGTYASPVDFCAAPNTTDPARLTAAAIRVVAAPWLRPPLDQISQLAPADISSIRLMLRDDVPNQCWPQALQVIALTGRGEDVSTLERAFYLPMPETRAIVQYRLLLKVKLTTPLALGILGNRTQSSSAVEILWDTAHLGSSEKVIGPEAAVSLSKRSLDGLAIANTAAARTHLDAIFSKQDGAAQNDEPQGDATRSDAIVRLSSLEVEHLRSLSAQVNRLGIEGYLRNGEGS
jgi:hypothetical protein